MTQRNGESPLNRAAFRPARATAGGFTYIGLLIFVAVLGAISAATLQLGTSVTRRAAEDELLAIGIEFQTALNSYADATPIGQKRAPASLLDLLKDPRYPGTRRHWRRIYPDPLTGKEEWGIVQGTSGIIGIYSLSTAAPIKRTAFDSRLLDFEDKSSYQAWKFQGALAQQLAPIAIPMRTDAKSQ